MKTKKQVESAYNCAVNKMQAMELWDGEPELYINQGWQQALMWVLSSRKIDSYHPYKEEE